MSFSTIAKPPAVTRTILLAALVGLTGPLGTIELGAAAQVPTCNGKPATIVGTGHHDALTGTPGPDVIVAARGWDRVDGAGGNDTICGGRGADHLYGGPGVDWINGQADGLLYDEDQYGDTIQGGLGNDTLNGGPGLYGSDHGLDVLIYTPQLAALHVDLANEVAMIAGQRDRVISFEDVRGTNFADILRGDKYFQFLSGYGGNDQVIGLGGPDFIDGDKGDDRLRGGHGNDYLSGGPGTDAGRGGTGNDYCDGLETSAECEH